MGIINNEYNAPNNLKEVRFCFMECYNNYKTAKALLDAVSEWGAGKGLDTLVGPLGFSDKDPQGFLIKGFDEPVVLQTNCNFPYMIEFMEKYGLVKKVDLYVYKLDIPEEIPEFYKKINIRALNNNNHLRLVNLETRRQMKAYVHPCLELVNETFTNIYAFAHLTKKEMDEFANRFLFLLDPHFLKAIETPEKKVIAFIIGMRDISVGIKKCRGRLLPFGILRVLLSQRKTKQLNLILGAIHPDYRNIGLDTVLGVSMIEEAHKAGLKVIDSHLELETNIKIRAEMEKMGGIPYKIFRIFQKQLS